MILNEELRRKRQSDQQRGQDSAKPFERASPDCYGRMRFLQFLVLENIIYDQNQDSNNYWRYYIPTRAKLIYIGFGDCEVTEKRLGL